MTKNVSPTPPIDELEALRQHRHETEAERLALIREGLAQIIGDTGLEEIVRRLRAAGHGDDELRRLYELAGMTPPAPLPPRRLGGSRSGIAD